ncbi:hypothetical protein [Liquorilactobacillus hordei]|nr:hypothetical protein [Liquorilactobacillus hordei]QYH51074.1 hypothetical protein G6O70_00500 [Liquorilactobacillus hordei DSM 19519]
MYHKDVLRFLEIVKKEDGKHEDYIKTITAINNKRKIVSRICITLYCVIPFAAIALRNEPLIIRMVACMILIIVGICTALLEIDCDKRERKIAIDTVEKYSEPLLPKIKTELKSMGYTDNVSIDFLINDLTEMNDKMKPSMRNIFAVGSFFGFSSIFTQFLTHPKILPIGIWIIGLISSLIVHSFNKKRNEPYIYAYALNILKNIKLDNIRKEQMTEKKTIETKIVKNYNFKLF